MKLPLYGNSRGKMLRIKVASARIKAKRSFPRTNRGLAQNIFFSWPFAEMSGRYYLFDGNKRRFNFVKRTFRRETLLRNEISWLRLNFQAFQTLFEQACTIMILQKVSSNRSQDQSEHATRQLAGGTRSRKRDFIRCMQISVCNAEAYEAQQYNFPGA